MLMTKKKRKLATNICGKRIKLARVEAGMNQLQLATALNTDFDLQVDQNSISMIEKDARFVKDFEIVAIAKALNISPMWLLFGDDQPNFRRTPLQSK